MNSSLVSSFASLVLITNTTLIAETKLSPSTPPLVQFSCVSSSDYQELLKLFTASALKEKEVDDYVRNGYVIGVVLERAERDFFGADFLKTYPQVIINPKCVISDAGVTESGTGRKLVLLAACVTSIVPPLAQGQVTIERSMQPDGRYQFHYATTRTRLGWTLIRSDENKSEPPEPTKAR